MKIKPIEILLIILFTISIFPYIECILMSFDIYFNGIAVPSYVSSGNLSPGSIDPNTSAGYDAYFGFEAIKIYLSSSTIILKCAISLICQIVCVKILKKKINNS